MSRRSKEEYYRFFSVTETRTHEKGHTEYKVTARFVSKLHPEYVKEVQVWRRFTELKKLHADLSYTHRNLFRREEEFPAFPRAQLFGRFDEAVIEERRKASEDTLRFTTSIPALYNSPQLKDFFRGGEVLKPLDPAPLSSSPLPPPLIPLPKRRNSDCLPAEEEEGREAPVQAQDLGSGLGTDLGEPEVAVEAYGEMESPAGEEGELQSDSEQDCSVSSPAPPRFRTDQSLESQEEFDSLFDSVDIPPSEEAPPLEEAPPPLSDNDLAIFDPCAKEEQTRCPNSHLELLSLPLTNPESKEAGYLSQAANELTAAMEREKEGEFSLAILSYRTAVDILITGVQGDSNPQRRESVKRRTAQYLQHAEILVSQHPSPSHTPSHTHTQGT